MITLFFILGVIATLFVVAIMKLNSKYKIAWSAWMLGSLGIFLLLFAIAWTISSVIEAEPRAASMGMVFFCVPAVILLAVGLRIAKRKKLNR